MSRPAYAVYQVNSMTGTAFSENDIPDQLHFVGSCEAVNGDAARHQFPDVIGPVLVLRMNTVEQHAIKN